MTFLHQLVIVDSAKGLKPLCQLSAIHEKGYGKKRFYLVLHHPVSNIKSSSAAQPLLTNKLITVSVTLTLIFVLHT